MSDEEPATPFAGQFVPGNPVRRRHFDHEFGAYVRRLRGHWHIEAIVDAVTAIAAHVNEADLQLQPEAPGRLHVTISFALEPIRTPTGRARDAAAQ